MGESSADSRTSWIGVAIIVVAAAVVHAVMAAHTELTPDEAYYASWAFDWTHGDDHPPLVGWLIAAATTVVGSRAESAVRLPAVLCSAASSILLAVAAARAGLASRWLLVAVAVAQLDVLAAAGGFLVTPDAPFMVAWSLVLVALASTEKGGLSSLALLVAAGALGGLAKVTMLLAIPVVALGSAHAGWRAAVGRTLAITAGIAMVAPFWWPSLAFQLGHVAGAHGPARLPGGTIAELGASVGAFVGLLGPGVFFFGFLGAIDARSAPARRGLLAAALVPLAVVLASTITAHVEASWTAPSHAPWILLATLAMRDRVARRAWRIGAVAAVALSALLCVAAHVFAITGAPWQPDPTARLRGWRDWANGGELGPEDAPDPRFPAYGLDAERRYYREIR